MLLNFKEKYRIAGNFCKPKFSENSFQWIFQKNTFENFGIFSFFATGLKNLKAPFRKKIFGEFLKFPKFPKIKFYENFQLYGKLFITSLSTKVEKIELIF